MRCMTEQRDLFSGSDDERGVADVCVSWRTLVLPLNWQTTKETHIGSLVHMR